MYSDCRRKYKQRLKCQEDSTNNMHFASRGMISRALREHTLCAVQNILRTVLCKLTISFSVIVHTLKRLRTHIKHAQEETQSSLPGNGDSQNCDHRSRRRYQHCAARVHPLLNTSIYRNVRSLTRRASASPANSHVAGLSIQRCQGYRIIQF